MELSKSYSPQQAEGKWYQFWEENGYFRSEPDPEKEPFSMAIPPPNVTGQLHIGHALQFTLHDIMIRYKKMDGYEACWFPGMDHAGIATQNVLERELEKEGLSKYDLGREEFVKRIWEWVDEYGGVIKKQLKTLGAACDWERERFTLDEGLSKAVTEVFVRLYEEGLVYRGNYIINWCPRCRTALSDIEVEHAEHQGKLYYIKYPLTTGEDSVTIATTRPETMLGDTGVAVNPEDSRYKDLVGKTALLPLMDREIPIVEDEAIHPDFGTGILKVTPAHDPCDFEIGERHNLETINIFNPDATLNGNTGQYEGLDRYQAREKVVEDLKRDGLLKKIEDYTHSIGHCQRCDTVVEPSISRQWFVEMKDLAGPAIQAIKEEEIELKPSRWKKVYFEWMENIQDWCISRQLWWGHRIPAWYCLDCEHIMVRRDPPSRCSKCNSSNLKQDEDVLDTWFSSALWPFTVMGWPKETHELTYYYPTSLLITGHDIIFFWVARMIMMGLHFMDEVPFQQVLLTPMLRDEEGQRMSTSKGNVIDPLQMKDTYGMDALRFTLGSLSTKGRGMKLSERDIEGNRKFLNKIWNAARFCLTHLGDFKKESEDLSDLDLNLEDRWILTRMNRTIDTLRESLEEYDFKRATKTLHDFVWNEFCDWYLEIVKPRLYGPKDEDKKVTQSVLSLVLKNILKMLHPFIPYITEEIYSRFPDLLKESDSLLGTKFPHQYDDLNFPHAEEKMSTLQDIIVATRTLRSDFNVPPQQRADVLIKTENRKLKNLIEDHSLFFKELAQVEELEAGTSVKRPPKAPRKVLEGMEIFVKLEGILNLAQERERLRSELEEIELKIQASSKKLANQEFTQKAPPQVVEKEKRKREEFIEKKRRLEENLKTLKVRAK